MQPVSFGVALGAAFAMGWFAKKIQVARQVYAAESTLDAVQVDKPWKINCIYRNALGIHVPTQWE